MRNITLFLSVLLIISCGGNTAQKPKHLLSEDEMANIIYDMNMAQAIRSSQPQVLNANNVNVKNYIYKKYKIDSLTFAQNNAWYAADMENYEAIQKKASDRIKKERDAFAPKKDTTKAVKPSAKSSIRVKRDSLMKAASDKAKFHETQK